MPVAALRIDMAGIVWMSLPIGPHLGEEVVLKDALPFSKKRDVNWKTIGNVLKRKYAGFTAWVFSSNAEAAKFIGLKPSEKIKLKNGPLDCLFLKFEIRDGKFVKNPMTE